jgi:hypothetical protein
MRLAGRQRPLDRRADLELRREGLCACVCWDKGEKKNKREQSGSAHTKTPFSGSTLCRRRAGAAPLIEHDHKDARTTVLVPD